MSSAAAVLLLGDPRLRVRSAEVTSFGDPRFLDALGTLAATLREFRARFGFGRAISAPQIGVPLRFIAADLGKGVFFVVNPVVTWTSAETFTMWDDCMSFPDLLVRVARWSSISLDYADENGRPRRWGALDRASVELLQHEIDHLDGTLAVDRALDRDALVLQSVYRANREYYDAMVDYTIARGAARS